MRRKRLVAPRPGHGTIVAYLALFVALGGSGYAATRVTSGHASVAKATPKRKPRPSEATVDRRQILAIAPSLSVAHAKTAGTAATAGHAGTADTATNAGNASALGGVPASGYLGSDHVVHGVADMTAPAGARILFDPATGADVRHHGQGVVEIDNTNSQDTLDIHGISEIDGASAPNPQAQFAQIAPGQSQSFRQQAIDPTYLDLIVVRVGSTPAQDIALHLTCGVVGNSTGLTCVGVR